MEGEGNVGGKGEGSGHWIPPPPFSKADDDHGVTWLPILMKAYVIYSHEMTKGAQWLSGRVLDLRPRGHRFEPHQCHCVVSLSKTH